MRNEVLRSSPEVYQFLSQTDNKTFENFKSKSEKRPIPDVYNLSSPDGKIKLDPNLMTDEFHMHDGFMKKSEGLKKQLTMLTRKLASVLHSAEQIF